MTAKLSINEMSEYLNELKKTVQADLGYYCYWEAQGLIETTKQKYKNISDLIRVLYDYKTMKDKELEQEGKSNSA